jgi:hypothetical protein
LVTSTTSVESRRPTVTEARAPGACLTTLVSASCTIRYAERSTATGRSGATSVAASTSSPAARADSSSCAMSRSRAGANRSTSDPSARSSRIIACISVSDWTLFSRTDRNTRRTAAGSPSTMDSTAADWMAMADRCPAITSCRSRAIRDRSACTAAVRSSSLIFASWSARARSAAAASRCWRTFTPHQTGMTGMLHSCRIRVTTPRRSCVDITETTTSTSTTAPVLHTTIRCVRRDPYSVAANSRSVNTMTVASETP